MKCRDFNDNHPAAMLRRTATIVGVAAGLLLTTFGGVAMAQQPRPDSPAVPTPYSWPNFHGGGGFLDSGTTGSQYLLPDTYSFSNPFSWQLNGTPTGLDAAGTAQTEIPSFLLGNYVPTLGPSGNTIVSGTGPNYFNHFRDGTIYNIAGPFVFDDLNIGSAAIAVDDNSTTSYSTVGTWTSVSATTNATLGDYASATNAEFQSHSVTYSTTGTATPTAAATWVVSPTYAGSPTGYVPQAGYYTLSVHVPNVEAATTTNASGATVANTISQVFSTDAHYVVLLNPVGAVNALTASTSLYKIADVRINQTTTNIQTVAGPILLAATDRLFVILDNTTLVSAQTTSAIPTVVAADSVSLQQNTGGDVESAPASVNDTEYNEIRNAEYYGIDAGVGSGSTLTAGTPPATTTTPDLTPRGNATPTVFGATNTATDVNHEIRQLVYFGRLETIPVLEKTGGLVVAARSTTTGQVITQQVGAVYCMDGLTGGIVWRYQTPGTYDVNSNVTSSSGAVFSSPALARINVRVDPSSTSTTQYATKLVVVIGDNRGFVYCLDAVGDRDGTSNTNAVYQLATATPAGIANVGNTTTDPALSNTPILSPTLGLNPTTGQINFPIYPANTGFGDFGSTTNASDPPHEGNTTAYWIYRPDPSRPKYVTGTSAQLGTVKTTIGPNSDLPVPGAFGPASPTIYVNGETATNTATDVPSATLVSNLTSNAIVYIGNSNGVLYALDALGFPVTLKTSTAGVKYLDSDTTGTGYQTPATGDPFNTVLDVENKLATATTTTTYIPTPAPIWWFSLRGAVDSAASTSTADIEAAPAVLVEKPGGNVTGTGTTPPVVTVYVTSAHEDDADGNSGRLYALDGNYGPSGNNGLTNLKYSTTANYQGPGSLDYNLGQRPQLPQVVGAVQSLGTATSDPYHWSFPDEYGQGQSSNHDPRPALGNMYGSPVVFADPNDLATDPIIGGAGTHPRVRIYVAANTGPEVPYDDTDTNPVAVASDDNTTGRIWAVNIDGSITKTTAASQNNGWSYPKAWDPNDAAHENTPDLSPPMGAFLHAAPAIGVVQFPATIIEGNGGTYNPTVDAKYGTGGIAGQDVSMLYIATSGQDDALDDGAGFYSLDIDGLNTATTDTGGTQDNNKEIEAIASPTGETFVSSPALVVNDSTPTTAAAAGNGGDVFVTGSNGTLFEFGATPITNNFADNTAEPYFPVDARLTGFSPISSPGLTAGSVTDLTTTTPQTADARDYVYVGFGNGLCYGITPGGFDFAGGFDPGTVGPAPGIGTGPAVGQVSNQFQLYTYVVDPTQAASMTLPTQTTTAATTAYEWGDNIYVRISNVIPATGYVYDSDGNAYSNGGPVTFTLTATSPRGGGTTTTTTPQTIPTTPITTLPGDGFFVGIDPNIVATDGKLSTTTGGNSVYIAATSFPVTNQEPGAQQRIISATQTASKVDPTTHDFISSVVLQATVGQGTEFLNASGQLTAERGATQPTFAILNPLAARGGGVPIAFSAASPQTAAPIGQFAGTSTPAPDQDGIGPFRGVTRPTPTTPNMFDLQAFSNGNRVYTTTLPPSGIAAPISGSGGTRRRNQNTSYPQHNVRITTATGMINDGAQGTNADPKSTAAYVTGTNADTQNGLPATGTSPYGMYTLDLSDRSDLGLAGLTLSGLRMDKHTLGWNDNNGLFSATGPTSGPGAMVNPLPWDTIPTTGSNHSSDYPDIGSTALSTLLKNTDITTQSGAPDGANLGSGGTNVDARNVFADATAIQVAVPKYQPANLQFFDQSDATPTPITPDDVNTSHTTFPMGYVARNVRVYVDSNGNGRWDQGEAYRTISVYSGVPVDLNTTIANTTTDLGKLPQGFGLQTESYPALGSFIPYPTSTEVTANVQTPGYTSFFRPLTILNPGNTNLLNVHVDQKLAVFGVTGTSALPLLGDSLESLATIPSYDGTGAVVPTPPSTAYLPNQSAVTEEPYLLRSSLDDDIITAYGRNPGLGTPYNTLGATFHKPRVGDASPTTMTVPDIPHDNNPGAAGGYYLAPNSTATATYPPIVGSSGTLVTASGTDTTYPNEAAYGPPYIALAIPQGTPVGTYSQNVRVFEGVNTNSTTGSYDPLMPPTYGTNQVVVNPYIDTTGTAPTQPTDTFLRSNTGVPAQPYSTPTVVRATVIEGRITDGVSNGSLPQVDSTAVGKVVSGSGATAIYGGAADFLPSAFRDPVSGNVSMYWVSSRDYTVTTPVPYNVFGANLATGQNGAFEADTANGRWLKSIGTGGGPLFTNTLPSGINSSLSIAPDQVFYNSGGTLTTDHSAYAFVQNVVPHGTAAFADSLYCYEVTPSTGALISAAVPVAQDLSIPKFGVHGLKFDTTFVDAYPSGTQTIGNNLWAFWYSGAGSRSAIYYNSSTASGGAPGAFGTPAVLPVPAGLVSVSDPNAVLTYAPDANGNSVPVIEVTYTGVAADGNSDIYVSRYRPYLVRTAQGTATTQVGLALVASPSITEQLQATNGNLYWQARDVGWARNGVLDVVANGIDLQLNATTTKAPIYDRATGTLVYANISPNGSAGGGTPITVYVDLSHGRIRFSPSLTGTGTAAPTVYATFSPQARRITTDPRADSAPVSFIDDSVKTNEAGFDNAANANSPVKPVKADRYWFIWRKSGASGTSTQPTLWYKTQRLTIDLHSTANLPVSLTLNAQQQPANLTVKDNTTGTTLYSSGAVGNAQVDVDWARGRIYFPIVDSSGKPLEGNRITVTFDGTDSNGNAVTGVSLTDYVHWLDEPRVNVSTTTNLAAVGSTTPSAGTTTPASSATGESEIPMDTTVNEGNVTAFLDPSAFTSLTQPHKVWLFWTSTRNGTADIYYETIAPLFSASVGQ